MPGRHGPISKEPFMTANSEKLAVIFGGSGFVGTPLVQELARAGYRVRVAVRRPDLAGYVRMFGFPGQIHPVQANVRNSDSVLRAASGADVVINLTGILFERSRQRFRAVHAMGAANVAVAAREAGAEHLVHMSALGAAPNSPSASSRSKALGEEEVLKAFPEAVIIRPSVIFGEGDGFLSLFASLARAFPILPLIGEGTRLQPVYVGDVVDALAGAAEGRVKPGKVYELGGPEILTMRRIVVRVLEETHRSNPLLPVSSGLAKLMAWPMGLLPKPLLTADQIVQLCIDNVVSTDAVKQKRDLAAFGVSPTPMEAVIPSYLWRFRRHGQFDVPSAGTSAS
jgi:NADH dehydrogenase